MTRKICNVCDKLEEQCVCIKSIRELSNNDLISLTRDLCNRLERSMMETRAVLNYARGLEKKIER